MLLIAGHLFRNLINHSHIPCRRFEPLKILPKRAQYQVEAESVFFLNRSDSCEVKVVTRIVIQSPCGGTGRTTLAANLGIAIARFGQPVLMEGQADGSLAAHFENWNPSIHSYGSRCFDGHNKRAIESNLYIADTTGQSLKPLNDLEDPRSNVGIESTKSTREFIITDNGDVALPNAKVLNYCDWVVFVIRPEARSLKQLALSLDSLYLNAKSAFPARCLIVLNQYAPESLFSRDIKELLKSATGKKLFPEPVLQDESIQESLARGVPLAEHAPYSPAHKTVQDIAQYLINSSDDAYVAA